MDNAEELIPEHFRFVKGLVDSQDLSLNISREMLQHDRQLKVIANRIEKKIKSELLLMLRNDREEYEKFWKNFGLQIKFGVYNDFGANKETLQDLLMFYSSKEQKLVTLDEYINRMEEGQEHIYFMSGDKVGLIDNLPQVKKVKEKGYEILYLTDNVDEFALQALMNYKEKTFKNISQGDLDLDSEEEKKELEKKKLDEAVGRVEEINDSITGKKIGFHCNEGSFPWFKTKVLNPLFNRFMTSAKPFYATDDCIGCKRCERICPVGNVVMIGWRPVWGMDCTSCLACYHVCPKHAVQYGRRTKRKGQYLNTVLYV